MASRSIEDYFLGGRKLPWWLLASRHGNFVDMTGTMLIVSFLFMLGRAGSTLNSAAGPASCSAFMMLWWASGTAGRTAMTGAEWMIYRLAKTRCPGRTRHHRRRHHHLHVSMLAYLIKGAGLFLRSSCPFRPSLRAHHGGHHILYCRRLRFYGVVYTDLFQCVHNCGLRRRVCVMASPRAGYAGDLGALAAHVTATPDG